MKNIVLIGFMGCGKSTFGKKISKKLNYSFVDTDKWIEKQQGQSIPAIFASQGETAFRQMETMAAQALAKEEGLVISTGGGMVKTPATMEALSQNAVIVYLKATPEHIFQNIGENSNTYAQRKYFTGNHKRFSYTGMSFLGLRCRGTQDIC